MIVDADLAGFYGVPTRRLNEQIKRNVGRFPEDFVFQLNAEEKQEVIDGLLERAFGGGAITEIEEK